MFTAAPPGHLGDSGRNMMRGPNTWHYNFSVKKDTSLRMLGEAGRVEFRAEFFNIFNHFNDAIPNGNVIISNGLFTPISINPTAGTALAGLPNEARQIQLALRFEF